MQTHLSRRFRMKYREPEKVGTFTGLMLSCMSSRVLVPITRHGFSDTLPGLLSTGFIGLSPVAWPGCGKGIGRAAPTALFPQMSRSCETKYSALPENWDTSKTSGMACCCLTTWKRTIPFRSVYDNAKGCSTSLGFPSKDPDDRLMKPTPSSRRLLKKLPRVAEGPQYPALVRRRSSFPAAQQLDTDVGTQGSTASCSLCVDPREGWLLWSGQFENGGSSHQRCPHFQRRDLWQFSWLSSPSHSREGIPDSGQRQMAQSASFERFFQSEPGPCGAYFPATLFARIEPGRTGMENYPQAGHTQPLFSVGRGT